MSAIINFNSSYNQATQICFHTLSKDLSDKLVIQDYYDIIKNSLNKALQSKIGKQIITDVLKSIEKVELIFDDKIKNPKGILTCNNDLIFKIKLNNLKLYSLTKASIEELPENFRDFFKNSNLKKVGNEFTIDQILVHEFYHIKNHLTGKADFETRINSPSLKNDMPNLEEEITILEGENLYLKELDKSERIDHLSCLYPNYNSLEKKQYTTQILENYIFIGAHVDALHLANKIEKNQLNELLMNLNFNNIITQTKDIEKKKLNEFIKEYFIESTFKFWKNNVYTPPCSYYFKDIFFALIILSNYIPVLMVALKNESLEIVKYLIKNGIDINFKDKNGRNALMFCAENFKNGKMIAEFLIEEKDININAKDNSGNTALMWAITDGSLDMLKFLVKKEADIQAMKHNSF